MEDALKLCRNYFKEINRSHETGEATAVPTTQVMLDACNSALNEIEDKKLTDHQIVDMANELARVYYKRMGYEVTFGYRFDKAIHPQEVALFDMACIAFDVLRETSVIDALDNIEEDEG